MSKYYVYNGVAVKCPTSSGKKYDRFIADNEHLVGCECTKQQYDAALAECGRSRKIAKRRKAYANGDYIDAIMKQFNLMRLNGDDLCQDMDAALAHWLNVKQDIPLD